MGQSKNPKAYPEAQEFMNRVKETQHSLSIGPFASEGAAMRFRHKCYSARKNWRNYSRDAYEEDHPMHSQSPWEGVSMEVFWHDGSDSYPEGYWVRAWDNPEGGLEPYYIVESTANSND